MNKRLYCGRDTLLALLAIVALALAVWPGAAQAQSESPVGVYYNPATTGAAGGSHMLVTIREDGSTAIAFFDLQAGLTNGYTGTWSIDPYGTVTLDLAADAEESCSGEEAFTTITFLPSTTGDMLTAVHYPKCLWGDGGLTLLRITVEQQAAIEDAYAEAGLMPGAVFQSQVIEAGDDSARQYTLNLGAAEKAMLIGDSLDGEEPVTELGEWTANVYSVTVTLTGTVDAVYDEPDVLVFGFVKDGSRSVVAYEYDQEKYGDQGLEMTYEPQAPTLMAAAEAAQAADIAGVYTSDVLPAADAPGLVQTLALFETGEAQNTSNYLDGEAPVVELGVWEDNQDGSITLVLGGAEDVRVTDAVTTTYTVSDQQLQAENLVLHKLPVVERD
jgi:hypothetical protein